MNHDAKKIVVFAGNDCTEEHRDYYFKVAYETGKQLAKAGYVVVTGAGHSLMHEAMRGASEAGGQTIGVGLKLDGDDDRKFVSSLTLYDKLGTRQEHLIANGDGFIVLPGGVGTLYEAMNILAFKRVGELAADTPFVFVDKYYKALEQMFNHVVAQGFIGRELLSYYDMADTPAHAVDLVNKKFDRR